VKKSLLLLTMVTAGYLQAGIIVAQTGSTGSFLSSCQSSCNQTLVFGFTLAQNYTNLNVDVLSAGNPTTGLAFLTTSIGPGTTVADEITSQTNTLAGPRFASGSYNTVLSLPFLAAGTYYVTLAANPSYGGDFYVTFSPSSVGDPGNSALVIPDFSFDVWSGGGYAPASNFNQSFGSVLFEISGSTAAPEPGTLALIGFGVPLAFLARRRSLRNR
jgi:hypothetical protein